LDLSNWGASEKPAQYRRLLFPDTLLLPVPAGKKAGKKRANLAIID